MESEITNICNELLQLYKDYVNKASGKLADSATYTVKWDGKYFEVWFNLQSYWKYIENGTRPHFPPIEPIEEWIKVKRLIPNPINGRVPTTRQFAYAIATTIARQGTQAYKPLQKTMDSQQADTIIDELVDAILQTINNQIENELEDVLS